MFSGERQNQERGQSEAGPWAAVEEQANRTSAAIKEKSKDISFRIFYNKKNRTAIGAAVMSLVLSAGCFNREENIPDVEPQPEPAVEASLAPGAAVEPNSEKIAETEEQSAKNLAELEELVKEFKKSDEEAEKNERERIRIAFEALPKKSEKEPEIQSEELVPPETLQVPTIAQESILQEKVDDETSKIDERVTIEGLPRDITYKYIKEGNYFAVDIGGRDYRCYKVTPETLTKIKKAQDEYYAKIKDYRLIKRSNRFTSGRLTQGWKEKTERMMKKIIKSCEVINSAMAPDEITKAQQERKEQNERVDKTKARVMQKYGL